MVINQDREGAFSIGAKDILERMADCTWDAGDFIGMLLTHEMGDTFEMASRQWLVKTAKAGADLQTVRKDIAALLELSDLLDKCGDDERSLFQERLSLLIEHIGYYLEAIRFAADADNPDNGAVHFLDSLMEKLRLSGYVYRPKKNFLIMSSLFLLKPELMDSKMGELFDVIGCRDLKTWQKEPFRRLLIQMLEVYIKETESQIDISPTQESLVNNIIRALSIQLLLATADDKALLDVNLNRAKLFRYISFLKVPYQQSAIDLAYRNLLGLSPKPINYSLEKTSDAFLLGYILSTPSQSTADETADTRLYYTNEHIQVRVCKDSIRFMPAKEIKGCKNVFPPDLLPWRHIEVLLPKKMKHALNGNGLTDINPYRLMWADIERTLLNPETEKVRKVSKRMMRLVGADVQIRIYRQDDFDPNKFYCYIDNAEGKGSIELKPDIVRYNVNADVRSFYSDNGYPLLLEATIVEYDEEGDCIFSMRDKIDEMTKDFADFADTVVCSIGYYDGRSRKYAGISKEGFPVSFASQDDMPQLDKYDVVELNNISFSPGGSLTGSFLRILSDDEPFSTGKAFRQLMIIYSNGDEYKGEEEELEEEALLPGAVMESSYVYELMMDIDRIASIEPNYIRAYNYIGVAKLLATMLEQKELVKYYKGRMDLLVMLHYFAVNDEVDEKRLKDLEAVNGEQIKNYTLLYTRFKQLKIISRLNHPEYNGELWTLKETAESANLQELASLVLSHNILRDYGLTEQANDVHNKIKNLFSLNACKSTLKDYGDVEDIQTEFKTSLIYPPGSMQIKLKKQMQLILTVIASMLNTLGGKLFLGVNNEGAGVGLEEDLKYFLFNYDKDKYQLYLRNAILSTFGNVVSAHIRIKFDDGNKQKDVCVIEIEPYKEGVLFENVWYVRQSSRKVVMTQQEFEQYNSHRQTKLPDVQPIETPPEKVVARKEAAAEAPKKVEAPKKEENSTQEIKTGKIRYINRIYEHDGSIYVNFFRDHTYMITDSPAQDTLLSMELLVADEYLVIVYTNGAILKIPVEEIHNKEYNQKYKEMTGEQIAFICPAKESEALLIVFKIKNDLYMRVDYVPYLPEGTMHHKGKRFTKETISEIRACEIMPSGIKNSFRNAKNLSTTGWLMNGKPGEKARLKLKELGISL